MHVTTTTIWESELRRQDLLVTARQQRRARCVIAQTVPDLSPAKDQPMQTFKIAARYARYLLTSLASVAFDLSGN